jgi:hypothetical protein
MLEIKDISKIEIYKIKYWCIYFRYENVHYMIRHIDECGDNWNELTNKETWEKSYSGYTLFDISDFIKLKYSNKHFRIGMPYKHIDLEYFTKCLVKQKLAKADNNLNKKE